MSEDDDEAKGQLAGAKGNSKRKESCTEESVDNTASRELVDENINTKHNEVESESKKEDTTDVIESASEDSVATVAEIKPDSSIQDQMIQKILVILLSSRICGHNLHVSLFFQAKLEEQDLVIKEQQLQIMQCQEKYEASKMLEERLMSAISDLVMAHCVIEPSECIACRLTN